MGVHGIVGSAGTMGVNGNTGRAGTMGVHGIAEGLFVGIFIWRFNPNVVDSSMIIDFTLELPVNNDGKQKRNCTFKLQSDFYLLNILIPVDAPDITFVNHPIEKYTNIVVDTTTSRVYFHLLLLFDVVGSV